MSGVGIRSLPCGKKFSNIFKVFLHSRLEIPVCDADVFLACVFALCTSHCCSVSANVVVVTAFGSFGLAVARQGLPIS